MDYRVAGLSPYDISTYPSPQAKYEPAIVGSGTCAKCAGRMKDMESMLRQREIDIGVTNQFKRENQELRRVNQSLVEQLQLLRELKANDDMTMGRPMNG